MKKYIFIEHAIRGNDMRKDFSKLQKCYISVVFSCVQDFQALWHKVCKILCLSNNRTQICFRVILNYLNIFTVDIAHYSTPNSVQIIQAQNSCRVIEYLSLTAVVSSNHILCILQRYLILHIDEKYIEYHYVFPTD